MKWMQRRRNEKLLMEKGFVRCAKCKKLVYRGDRYCQYCGVKLLKNAGWQEEVISAVTSVISTAISIIAIIGA